MGLRIVKRVDIEKKEDSYGVTVDVEDGVAEDDAMTLLEKLEKDVRAIDPTLYLNEDGEIAYQYDVDGTNIHIASHIGLATFSAAAVGAGVVNGRLADSRE